MVIPAEARKRLNIAPGDKLIVLGHPFGEGIALVKIDSLREFLSTFLEGISTAVEGEGHKAEGK